MKKKKIVILTNSMANGGAERIVSYLLSHLGDEYETQLLLFENKIEYKLPENQVVSFINKNHNRVSDFTSIYKFPLLIFNIPLFSLTN